MADAVLVIGTGDDAVDFSSGEAGMEVFRRRRSWRWPSQQPIGARPAHSYTGEGDETVTISGVVFPGQVGDKESVARIEALADQGQPHPIADGDGQAYGLWVILSIEEERKGFYPGGTPRKVSWSLELEAFTPREVPA